MEKDTHGTVVGTAGTKPLAPKEVLEVPCDILIPAALETQITTANADLVDARVVIEAANGPTTPEADRILADRGIPVVPDLLSAGGGVVVSYFEWMQNLANESWEEKDVQKQLRSTMRSSTDKMLEEHAHLHRSLDIYREVWAAAVPDDGNLDAPTLRTAAYAVALRRCRQATEQRGIWP